MNGWREKMLGTKIIQVPMFVTNGLSRLLQEARSRADGLEIQAYVVKSFQRALAVLRASPENAEITVVRQVVDQTIAEKLAVDEDAKRIKCRKGCSACCHIRVEVTDAEMRDVRDQWFDKERLAKQVGHGDSVRSFEKLSWEDKLCVFNRDGNCTIYEKRPLGCRLYFVASDPIDCDTRLNPGGQVLNYQVNRAEIIASAYAQFCFEKGEYGALPDVLSRVLEAGDL